MFLIMLFSQIYGKIIRKYYVCRIFFRIFAMNFKQITIRIIPL